MPVPESREMIRRLIDEEGSRSFGKEVVDASGAPPVDPDSSDLSDLFAWGRWVAEQANLSPERSKEILEAVRRLEKATNAGRSDT